MYQLLRRLLFLFPPESVHYFSMNFLRLLRQIWLLGLVRSVYGVSSKKLEGNWHFAGLHFQNPIGLGAGFDKNARYLSELEALGFGFVEIGTVTPIGQKGNPAPRLFRLPIDKGLINRMGFNNEGAVKIAERLKLWKQHNPSSKLIIGGNIGKNKQTSNENAWKDYETCFKALHPYVDYFVVNVSSPNTPGLRALQEKDSLRQILRHLQMINNAKAKAKPLFLKIAPDLEKEQLDDVIDLAMEIQLDGIVATNTTTSREGLQSPDELKQQQGGLSGLPLKKKSTDIVKYICARGGQHFPVIASGGVFTAGDAKEKFNAGASLLQVWTGFIYEGPAIVKKICHSLFIKNNNAR
jgi:dihydroorotate dehydrogenase